MAEKETTVLHRHRPGGLLPARVHCVGELDGKVIAITGAASGIGRATALLAGREGARVGVIDTAEDAGRETARMIESSGAAARFYSVDVTSARMVAECFRMMASEWGRIDGLVNNAGINGPTARIEDYPEDEFDRIVAVNLKSVWLGMRAVLPHMRAAGGGSIVNSGSTASFIAYPGMSGYNASKHAVLGLTKSAALGCAPWGIRVNCICPAAIDTPMMRDTERRVNPQDPAAARRLFAAQMPINRVGEAEEVAAVVLFLLSDRSSYVTGSAYLVDGGMMARP